MERRRAGFRVLLIALFMVLLLLPTCYVLSIGPATWWVENGSYGPRRNEFIAWFYAPITWLCYEFPMVGKVIGWYQDFWQDSKG